MSITPSIPILHGRKGTDLRVFGQELILRRATRQEHHIPFPAIARVHFTVLSGGVGFTFTIAAWLLAPEGLRPWRLPRHGITVTAEYAHDSAQPWLYLYSDLDGNVWRYLDSSGLPALEVSYDPRDPAKAVRADGTGRWIPGILPLSAGIVGLLLLVAFLATPFMDLGTTGEEYRNQYR
ncbi:hypothetical protein [Streptomyces sp. NBC_01264]|uniref:hypothetical protein n=1 Tax=Streptomyces sp. NBC_01264 TaxID=2903804 RepID=UPI00225400FF|nr:hypothetical protein [Streptomyces sp. NBC_01264]MCX4782123.1 hypothetical protein [Streptomyces sp. NBC_01264]